MKKLLLPTIIFAAGSLFADITWRGEANPVLGPDDPTNIGETSFATPLTASSFGGTGFFLQLLYAGTDGIINNLPAKVASAAELTGRFGAQGDDVVVDTRYVGANRFFDNAGKWNAGDPYSVQTAGNYFVRAWAGVSADPAKANASDADAPIPLPYSSGGIDFWWVGESDPVPSSPDPLNLGLTDFSATQWAVNQQVQVIPEPSTFALMGLGGALAFIRIRRRK